ncbi:MAG: hypothetical protein ABI967_06500 [bacterium]
MGRSKLGMLPLFGVRRPVAALVFGGLTTSSSLDSTAPWPRQGATG